jgi:hypothetical protein
MRLKHKSLFHTMTKTEFNQAVEKLDAVIPALNVSRIRASFGQTVVAVQELGWVRAFTSKMTIASESRLSANSMRSMPIANRWSSTQRIQTQSK